VSGDGWSLRRAACIAQRSPLGPRLLLAGRPLRRSFRCWTTCRAALCWHQTQVTKRHGNNATNLFLHEFNDHVNKALIAARGTHSGEPEVDRQCSSRGICI
jgi:hypothetical protein